MVMMMILPRPRLLNPPATCSAAHAPKSPRCSASESSVSATEKKQRQALKELSDAFGLARGRWEEHIAENQPLRQWSDVRVDQRGNVVKLILCPKERNNSNDKKSKKQNKVSKEQQQGSKMMIPAGVGGGGGGGLGVVKLSGALRSLVRSRWPFAVGCHPPNGPG